LSKKEYRFDFVRKTRCHPVSISRKHLGPGDRISYRLTQKENEECFVTGAVLSRKTVSLAMVIV
jgi:hypothetical protein